MLLQSLGELYNAVRKKRPSDLAAAHRWIQRSLVLFEITAALPEDLPEAIDAHQHHDIPFWDAMLWATARRAGCTLFLTEDLQDGRSLEGITFRNPFKLSESELDGLLE